MMTEFEEREMFKCPICCDPGVEEDNAYLGPGPDPVLASYCINCVASLTTVFGTAWGPTGGTLC